MNNTRHCLGASLIAGLVVLVAFACNSDDGADGTQSVAASGPPTNGAMPSAGGMTSAGNAPPGNALPGNDGLPVNGAPPPTNQQLPQTEAMGPMTGPPMDVGSMDDVSDDGVPADNASPGAASADGEMDTGPSGASDDGSASNEDDTNAPMGAGGSGDTETEVPGAGGTGADGTDGMQETEPEPAAPCTQGGSLQPGDSTNTIDVDGTERTYFVHVPPSYDGTTRTPVVFDFHGLGGNGQMWRTASRWAQYADTAGYIAVYPSGIENGWNAGICCNDETTDVAFVRAMIDTLDNDGCIDTKRVYATGCSNGGGMSFRLACEAADVIAAVAPVDFDCVLGSSCGDCNPSRPITEIQFRATNDSLVDYEGNGAFMGAENNLAKWGELNVCDGSPEAVPDNGKCQQFPMCSDGVETILCTEEGGSHCGNYSSLMIPEVGWEVLQRHTLP